VGATADRVFIGDKDGTLWRLNLTTENGVPDEWTMQLFWDGFPEALHDWNDGQPIVTPPILSVDQRGNLTVAFSTGEPDLIGGAPALANHVWSLREELSDDRLELLPKVNWHLDFTDTDQGEHVVGSMALFNENLYFATMSVPGENAGACENGQGRLWGMHYLRPNPDGPGKGGEVPKTLQDLTPSGTDDFVKADVFSKDPNVVLAGVAIAQQPTCFNDDGGSDDEYFKSGVHHGLGSTSGGKFQLFVPIGTGQVADNSKVESVDMGGAQAAAIELPTPPVLTRVDSWAAIVE
jgi:type IV pilus assembly protein PilY1